MKTCVIYGDMSSESATENYPTVQICDDCIEADEKLGENAQIVIAGKLDPTLGETCEFCGKSYEDEVNQKK